MSFDIWLPLAKRVPLALPGPRVPPALLGRIAGAFGWGALPVEAINQAFGGRSARPTKPLVIYGPDQRSLTFLIGGGETEAAELQDMAAAIVDQQARRVRNQYHDEQRERRGLVRREKFDAAIREGLAAQAEHQRRNPSEYHRPPPDRSYLARLPELTLDDHDREELARWQ